MRLKVTPELIQEFLDVSTSSSSEELPPTITSSMPVTMVTPSSSMSVLRTSSPMISSSLPPMISLSSILILPSSSSSSSSPGNQFQNSEIFLSSPTLESSSPMPLPSSSTSSSSLSSITTTLSSSFVPSFALLKSPQKTQFVLRNSVTSRTASRCLFGPSDSQQNKIDCDKLMKLSTRRNIDLIEEDSKPDNHQNKSIHSSACAHLPANKRRRIEGHVDGCHFRKKMATTDEEDGTVWRSPKKFGNNLVRLVPKITPLRRDGQKNCAGDDDVSSAHPTGLFTFCNPVHLSPEHTAMDPKTSFGVDSSAPTQSTEQCPLQEMLPKRVPVVQLKQASPLKLRRISRSNPNSKRSNSGDVNFGDEVRRSSSFSQLCSSLERISTHDLNNNNTINDNSKTKSSAARKLNFPSKSGRTSPCTVSSTNPENQEFSCRPCESMMTWQDDEARATISPDSSMEDRWPVDDPYLRLIRERESLGFVPINRFESRDETSGSLDE